MARRPPRSNLAQRLITPVATRIRRRVPRILHRSPSLPIRWSVARRLVPRPMPRTRSGGS